MGRSALLIFEQPLKFVVDVHPVSDLSDTQHLLQDPGHSNGVLMRDNVAHLVGQHARKLVVAARQRHHLARDINSSARQAEGVHLRQFDQIKAESQMIWRKIAGQPTAQLLEMHRHWIVNQSEFTSQVLGHGIAQIDLLLVSENVLACRSFQGRRLRTALLSHKRRGEKP